MKTAILLSTIIIILCSPVYSQDYKIAASNSTDASLVLDGFSGQLTIEGYSGNDIVISPAEKVETPERAKGLKPVYSNGVDNTGLGLKMDKDGNKISIRCLLPFTNQKDFTIKVPENMALKITSECQNNNDVFVSKMKSEIEIQTCQSIKLEQVSGPLVLSTISGDIDITFGTINSQKPFAINSVSGEIDITMPSKLAADIEMNSVTGNMYSDFDFNNSDKNVKQVGGNNLEYKMNGGGVKFSIVTVSGNIYLRKGA
jgi:lia operon protein LiaG